MYLQRQCQRRKNKIYIISVWAFNCTDVKTCTITMERKKLKKKGRKIDCILFSLNEKTVEFVSECSEGSSKSFKIKYIQNKI